MIEEGSLLFEFADKEGKVTPQWFRHPLEVLTAASVEEVQQIFARVDELLNQGYYVAGYVAYEAAPAFDESFTVHTETDWPLVWFGVYDGPVEDSGDQDRCGSFSVSDWQPIGDYETYKEGIGKIKEGIERGDTYQVNYTTRLRAAIKGEDYAFYRQLVENQRAKYSAYLHMGERRVLSASPELFFRIDGSTITTKPMKGTAPRGRTYEEDEQRKRQLVESEKERSENLMIVDLLRNDVGRIARPGSVRVPRLFDVETYPTVHQMTSTIEAELPDICRMGDIFQALFPCGSITGAPKVRTMEYISRLELSPRGVYCGAIGYMTPKKEAVFNVPIRTVMLEGDKAVYGTGGGVTWDSTSEGEYEELHTKARLLKENRPEFRLLETMRLEDGRMDLLSYHLQRLSHSADYFDFRLDESSVKSKLEEQMRLHPHGAFKVRLLVDRNGESTVEVHSIDPPHGPVVCGVADQAVDEDDPFLYHKTTHRTVYEQHQKPGMFATLLWNSREELTEFTFANLVVKDKGKYYTPPVSSGLLAGTFRAKLLDEGVIEEKVLEKPSLSGFEEVWMVNSVRGWIRVDFE